MADKYEVNDDEEEKGNDNSDVDSDEMTDEEDKESSHSANPAKRRMTHRTPALRRIRIAFCI